MTLPNLKKWYFKLLCLMKLTNSKKLHRVPIAHMWYLIPTHCSQSALPITVRETVYTGQACPQEIPSPPGEGKPITGFLSERAVGGQVLREIKFLELGRSGPCWARLMASIQVLRPGGNLALTFSAPFPFCRGCLQGTGLAVVHIKLKSAWLFITFCLQSPSPWTVWLRNSPQITMLQ